MRTVARPRRYVPRAWIALARPALRYSPSRDAFVLRLVGNVRGPVLRTERRRRDPPLWDGVERRGAHERTPALTL